MPRSARLLFPLLLVFAAGGCVNRVMTVKSDPPGALVIMNDQEVGRTPLKKEFLWYGNYDVVVRKDGYETLKTQASVMPPVWQIIPLDLITDLMPLTDEHVLTYSLKPQQPADPAVVMAQGTELRQQLESSEHTKIRVNPPAPATKPSTQPSGDRQK